MRTMTRMFWTLSILVGSFILGFIILSSWPSFALAEDAAKKKKSQIDFEDQLIQGEVKKPELFYLLQKKQFNFGKLIKMRENFIPEMTKTSEDIKKGR